MKLEEVMSNALMYAKNSAGGIIIARHISDNTNYTCCSTDYWDNYKSIVMTHWRVMVFVTRDLEILPAVIE